MIILFSLIIVVVISFFVIYKMIANPPITPAFLNNVVGNVEVDTGSGWQSATHGQELDAADAIRTNQGSVDVYVGESLILALTSGSEITLDTIGSAMKVTQKWGRVWNKFTGLAGVTSYENQMPTTKATVRGTGFLTIVDKDETVIVGEGIVDQQSPASTISLSSDEKGIYNGTLVKAELTLLETQEVKDQMKMDIERLKTLRRHLLSKNQFLVGTVKKTYGLSDSDVESYLAKIDTGELNDADLLSQAPFKAEVLTRIKALNDEIKQQMKIANE